MRRNRSNYIMRFIPSYFLAMCFFTVGKAMADEGIKLIGSILILLALVCIIYVVYLAIGRLKDMNTNPWLSVLSIIPFISLIFFIAIMFPKGTEGENKYGDDPLTTKIY